MSFTYQYIILDIADNWGQTSYISMRSLELRLLGSLIPLEDNSVVDGVATTQTPTSYLSRNAAYTILSKTGSDSTKGWRSTSTTNQRWILKVLAGPVEFDEIVINNGHSSSYQTNAGMRNVKITCSNSYPGTTYNGAITGGVVLFDGEIDIHPEEDIIDDQSIPLSLPPTIVDLIGSPLSTNVTATSNISVILTDLSLTSIGDLSSEVLPDWDIVTPIDFSLLSELDTGINITLVLPSFELAGNLESDIFPNVFFYPIDTPFELDSELLIAGTLFSADMSALNIASSLNSDLMISLDVPPFESLENDGSANILIILGPDSEPPPAGPSGITAKSVILDITNNHRGSRLGIRSIEFKLGGTLIDVFDGVGNQFIATNSDLGYEPQYAFITGLRKDGTSSGVSWLTPFLVTGSQRLSIVFAVPIEFDEIVINNYHSAGGGTEHGAYVTKITASIDSNPSSIFNSPISNPQVLFYGAFGVHNFVDGADDETVYYAPVAPPTPIESPLNLSTTLSFETPILRYVFKDSSIALYHIILAEAKAQSFDHYKDKPTPLISSINRYNSSPSVNNFSTEKYKNVATVLNSSNDKYKDYLITLQRVFSSYSLLSSVINQSIDTFKIIDGTEVKDFDNTPYNLLENNSVLNNSKDYWLLRSDSVVQELGLSFTLNGEVLNVHSISTVNIHYGIDQFCMSVVLTLNDVELFNKCTYRSILEVTTPFDTFTFLIDNRSRNRSIGNTSMQVTGTSLTADLALPYAKQITKVFSSELVSTIAQDLASPFVLEWNTVDWVIPDNTLSVVDQTPIEIIKLLASACGAVILTTPDNILKVEPKYPINPSEWESTETDLLISDDQDIITQNEQDEIRSGYNRVTLSNQELVDEEAVSIEEIHISATVKQLQVYSVPFNNSLLLQTSGGVWVSHKYLETKTESITETIEFINGEARTTKPIYGIASYGWKQKSLGTLTFKEDGQVSSSVVGHSLLEITYSTKYLLYEVSSPEIEKVQFYMI